MYFNERQDSKPTNTLGILRKLKYKYIDEINVSSTNSLDPISRKILLDDLYNDATGAYDRARDITTTNKEHSKVVNAFSTALYIEEDVQPSSERLDALLAEYNRTRINKLYGLNIIQYLELTRSDMDALIKSSDKYHKDMNKILPDDLTDELDM